MASSTDALAALQQQIDDTRREMHAAAHPDREDYAAALELQGILTDLWEQLASLQSVPAVAPSAAAVGTTASYALLELVDAPPEGRDLASSSADAVATEESDDERLMRLMAKMTAGHLLTTHELSAVERITEDEATLVPPPPPAAAEPAPVAASVVAPEPSSQRQQQQQQQQTQQQTQQAPASKESASHGSASTSGGWSWSNPFGLTDADGDGFDDRSGQAMAAVAGGSRGAAEPGSLGLAGLAALGASGDDFNLDSEAAREAAAETTAALAAQKVLESASNGRTPQPKRKGDPPSARPSARAPSMRDGGGEAKKAALGTPIDKKRQVLGTPVRARPPSQRGDGSTSKRKKSKAKARRPVSEYIPPREWYLEVLSFGRVPILDVDGNLVPGSSAIPPRVGGGSGATGGGGAANGGVKGSDALAGAATAPTGANETPAKKKKKAGGKKAAK